MDEQTLTPKKPELEVSIGVRCRACEKVMVVKPGMACPTKCGHCRLDWFDSPPIPPILGVMYGLREQKEAEGGDANPDSDC